MGHKSYINEKFDQNVYFYKRGLVGLICIKLVLKLLIEYMWISSIKGGFIRVFVFPNYFIHG